MKRILTILAATLASPALALSCLPPDPVSLYERARDADERFVIVRGVIEPLDDVAVPNGDSGPKTAETPARMSGQSLSGDSFGVDFDREITLRLTCAGPWCANAPTDQKVIVPLLLEGGDMVLVLDPCFSTIVEATEDGEARLLACHVGTTCQTGF